MPSFCEYRNCHNLASSTWSGYCNEVHFLRAQRLEYVGKLAENNARLMKLLSQQETKREKEEDKKK